MSAWSWLLSLVGVAGFWLAGRKVWWAWYVNIANQALWTAYALVTAQWGFLVGVVVYTWVFVGNARRWTAEHQAEKAFERGAHSQVPAVNVIEISEVFDPTEGETMKYRKKPVVIEARQLVGDAADWHAVYQWIEANTLGSFDCNPIINGEPGAAWPASGVSIDARDGRMVIATLEGGHWCDLGDWIIQGVQGEFYPCKPEIFEATYEEVDR